MGATIMGQEKELTIKEVAERLGVDYQTARKRIVLDKLIRARREGLVYRVKESDLEKYIEWTYRHGEDGSQKTD